MTRGSTLLAVLLVLTVVFVLGLALLTRQLQANRGAAQVKAAELARALAEAGLEDARLKLERDGLFPPAAAPDQPTFTWSEDLGEGRYEVTVDSTYRNPPHLILRIISVGSSSRRGEPGARRGLVAELDASPYLRSDPSQPNPQPLRIIRVYRGEL